MAVDRNRWKQNNFDINLPAKKAFGPVSEADIDYVCDHSYPFIQLINPTAEFGEKFNLDFVKTPNNWIIHNYGGAISTSAPHANDSANACSIPNQIIVAKEILKIIENNKWPSVELIAGTSMMKFLLWAKAEEIGLDWFGYTPDEKDKKRLERLIKFGLMKKGKTLEVSFTTVM